MTTVPYSSSDYLKTDEDIIEYLNAAVEDGDNSVLLLAMRNVAMAKGGIAKLADITGLNRESLCDNGLPAIHPGEFLAEPTRKRYTLAELLEGYNPEYAMSEEAREWENMPPVGNEVI